MKPSTRRRHWQNERISKMVALKTCKKCGKEKPLDAFRSIGKKGTRNDCIECGRKESKEYAANHREQRRAYFKRYWTNQEVRERILARHKIWMREHPENNRASVRKYRALKEGQSEHFTLEEWNELLAKFNYRCAKCGSTDRIEADHIVPIKRGGKDTIDNIQPLCRPCNISKNARTADYRNSGFMCVR